MEFEFIPPFKCIKCGKEIEPLYPDDPILTAYDMVKGGIVGTIYAPFGSNHDGSVYQIGICDSCVNNTPELVLIGDYLMDMSAESIKKHEEECDKRHEELRPTFEKLKQDWLKESMVDSMSYPLRLPAQKIVDMGLFDALPFVIEEMQKDPLEKGDWFVVADELLKAKGFSKLPEVPEDKRGIIVEINKVYLEWLEEKGFIGRTRNA
jgi:hypothetical protein